MDEPASDDGVSGWDGGWRDPDGDSRRRGALAAPMIPNRIELAARAMYPGSFDETNDGYRNALRADAREILAAAFPELFTDPPQAWLAPWEATDVMRSSRWAWWEAWDRARNAHLASQSDKPEGKAE